ncbi:MAG: C-GCAxxG-C-C family protein [Candidatus Freyarchaeota archaeon]|nr:C-GCAxxG-C-C family protein [Candidatus Freyrarchaeum guaymaensis]
MNGSNDDLPEKAFKLGREYEKKYTGCAQTVIAAIFDTLGIKNDDVFKAASGLADGLGLTGDGSCGALVGSSMVISYLYGRERKDFHDIWKPMKSYILVKRLHDQFVEEFGSCRCYDIQKRLMGRTFNLYDPKELEEAINHRMFDYCSRVVGTAAKLATRIILEEGLPDSKKT